MMYENWLLWRPDVACNLACCPLGHSLAANNHHHYNHHHHHQQPWAPPATKKVYWARNSLSVEYVLLFHIVQIFAIHSEYFRYASCLPSSEKISKFFLRKCFRSEETEPAFCRLLWIFGPMTQIWSSKIQYLTSPDQKLSKIIYFMGS